jgi:hypothetical protein
MTRAPPDFNFQSFFIIGRTTRHGIVAASPGKPADVNFTGTGAATA